MNYQCFWSITEPDRTMAREVVKTARYAETCVCGGGKRASAWFCVGCAAELVRAGLAWELKAGLERERFVRGYDGEYEFVEWDRLADVVQALLSKRWSGRAARREAES